MTAAIEVRDLVKRYRKVNAVAVLALMFAVFMIIGTALFVRRETNR